MITLRIALESEIKELEGILREIPAENIIERVSFESRLCSVRVALEQLSEKTAENQTTARKTQ